MEVLLHPPDDASRHPPDRRGRLSTIGHGAAFRAFARAAKRAGIRYMVIGGTFRDIAVRAASTRHIDIVVVDRAELPHDLMRRAGFTPVTGAPHAWRYRAGARLVELQVAAVASSHEGAGPFSVAFRHAARRKIEVHEVAVPRIADYVILKLLAAASDARRRNRDLADVQFALEAHARTEPALSVPALRARLRDLYGVKGRQLKDLVDLVRLVPRPR